VLKHEFVHVINLQQTNFNIPHWFTEAIATMFEDQPRPVEWNALLVRRAAEAKLFTLDSINLGFIRPQNGDDWQMAYCQAELYAEHMVAKYGEPSLGKMLAAYRDNLTTKAAIQRALGVSQEEFESGYQQHLKDLVASLAAAEHQAPLTFSALQKKHEAEPENLEIAAQLAVQHLMRQSYPEAGKLADKVLKKDEKHQLATYVKARLLLVIGEGGRAAKMLAAALDRDAPQKELLNLLAGLKYKAEQFAEAEALYELGEKEFPHDPQWSKRLSMIYLKTGEKEKLADRLTRLAEADPDDLTLRKKLAELAQERGDHESAAKWANQCIEIDVMDVTPHQILAAAFSALEKYDDAVRELKVALELKPDDPDLQSALAAAQTKAKQP